MDKIAARLREARKSAGYDTVKAAVDAFGLQYQTYAAHENGRRGLGRDAVLRYARAFKVSAEWLLTGKGERAPRRGEWEIGGEAYLPLPVYDINAAAGDGALVEDGPPIAHHVFREQFLRSMTRAPLDMLSVIRVSGDSMWETLHDGDSVLVDRTVTRVVREGIYIVLFEGELIVKRCQRDFEDGALHLLSDNPKYPARRVSDPDRITVVGRVLWIGRLLG